MPPLPAAPFGCRVCEDCFAKCTLDNYCMRLIDVLQLEKDCQQFEKNVYDGFNAYCEQCRRVSMSVPVAADARAQCAQSCPPSPSMQVSYLAYQCNLLREMLALQLV